MNDLNNRLNKILERITSEDFLSNKGLGNEIGFYIFDYKPEEELEIRKHIDFLLSHIEKHYPRVKVKHINLFQFVVDYLKQRNLLDKAIQLQRKKGDNELLKALKSVLDANKIADYFDEKVEPQKHDFVIISGVGNVYPLIRTHSILNNLHKSMSNTPLVMFYPGVYTGKGLRLFGRLKESNYYRAFKLVS